MASIRSFTNPEIPLFYIWLRAFAMEVLCAQIILSFRKTLRGQFFMAL